MAIRLPSAGLLFGRRASQVIQRAAPSASYPASVRRAAAAPKLLSPHQPRQHTVLETLSQLDSAYTESIIPQVPVPRQALPRHIPPRRAHRLWSRGEPRVQASRLLRQHRNNIICQDHRCACVSNASRHLTLRRSSSCRQPKWQLCHNSSERHHEHTRSCRRGDA